MFVSRNLALVALLGFVGILPSGTAAERSPAVADSFGASCRVEEFLCTPLPLADGRDLALCSCQHADYAAPLPSYAAPYAGWDWESYRWMERTASRPSDATLFLAYDYAGPGVRNAVKAAPLVGQLIAHQASMAIFVSVFRRFLGDEK